MSIIEIGKWNYLRNGLEYNPELEQNMLDEEAKEFKDAFTAYLALTTSDAYYAEDTLLDEVVDMVDAYCDYMYVYTGTSLKSIGFKHIDASHTQSVMHSVLTEVLLTHGVRMYDGKGTLPLLEEAFQYVIEANNKKPLTKTKGKVTKGKDFIDPKALIKDLLKAKGFVADAEEALENYKKSIEEAISTKPKQIDINEIN
jgi:hypothetical protein